MAAKTYSKPDHIWDSVFSASFCRLQKWAENLGKHLRCAFCANSQKLKVKTNSAKTVILDVWQGSLYACILLNFLPNVNKICVIFKSVWLSKVTDNVLLGKIKKKEQNELINSCSFELYDTQSSIS